MEGAHWVSSVLMFQLYTTKSASNMFSDPSSFEKGRQIPLNQCSSTWRESFHQLNAETLLTVESTAFMGTLTKSAILHLDAGRGSFVVR